MARDALPGRNTMSCPVCGAENEATATFCFRCGTRLQSADPATGATVALRPGDTPPFGMPVAERAPDALSGTGDAARAGEGPNGLAPAAPPVVEPRVYSVPSSAPTAGGSPPISNNATISLVLALVGQVLFWVLACVSLGALSVLATAAGIPAVIVGRNAQREIRASGGRIGGEGVATAGVVIGWITIGLGVLSLIIFVVLLGGLAILAS
jgi:hypothetical protein